MKSHLFKTNAYAHEKGVGNSYKRNLPRVGFRQVVGTGVDLVDGEESRACSTCMRRKGGSDHCRCMYEPLKSLNKTGT